MRTLEVNAGGGVLQRHFLLAGETYTIGRKECRILLPNGDPSISRHHADLTVKPQQHHNHNNSSYTSNGNDSDENDVATAVDFVLRDCSKHGTFVNREPLGRDTVCFLYPDDIVKFGKRVSARVSDTGMVLLLAESPFLSSNDRQILRDAAWRLGAFVVRGPVPSPATLRGQAQDVIALLYITHDGYEMTPEILLAMAQQYFITTAAYVQSLVEALREKCACSPAEFPTPTVPLPANIHFHKDEYTPPVTIFYEPGEFLSRGSTGEASSLLLRQYTFLFLDTRVHAKYEALLQICGATVVLISPDNATKFHAHLQDIFTIALTSDEMFESLEAALALGKEQQTIDNSHTNNGNNQNGGKKKEKYHTITKNNENVEAAYITLYKAGICVIPELNVQRAIFTGNASEINATPTARCLICREKTPNTLATEKDTEKNDSMVLNHTVQRAKEDVNINVRKREIDSSKPLREIEKNTDSQALNGTAAPLENEKSNRVKETRYEELVNHHRENEKNEKNGTLGKEPRASVGSSIQPTVHHSNSSTERKRAESMNASSSQEREVLTRTDTCRSLERRPVVVHVPSQMTADGIPISTPISITSAGSPIRRRVIAHKVSTYTPQRAHSAHLSNSEENEPQPRPPHEVPRPSSQVLTSAAVSRTSSRLPSVEPAATTHLEVLQRQQNRRQQRKAFESGNTTITITTNPTTTTTTPTTTIMNTGRNADSTPSSIFRRGSTPSIQYGETTHRSRSNGAQKPRASSVVDSQQARQRTHSLLSYYGYTTHSSPRDPQRPQLYTKSALGSSSARYRRNSTGRSPSPVMSYNRMGSKPLIYEAGESTTAGPSSSLHRQQLVSARSKMERNSSARGTDGMMNSNPNSTEAVEYIRMDKVLGRQAADFLRKFLDIFAVDAEKSCRLLMKQGYLDAMSKKFLEGGMQRVQEFLTFVQKAQFDIPPMYSTETTRQYVHEVRRKSHSTLDRIRCTYEAVKAELPAFLIQQQQQQQQQQQEHQQKVRSGSAVGRQSSLQRMSSVNSNRRSSFLYAH
ncbi:putative recombination initiation protein NBS1 [Trypanosoma theileri]|uniref:Putative recombination initiation protein NBS1 n=1 Tax=Trypanosoma theileri TaxID=67003 RepID=A0A1X0NGM4_9TRYP|nr:putative recombination initiation protein NBS1 [Trypanosoma theileri]ORC83603.1 putative recombination initiation protein NBS1 [Trypanosoma theileri]